jgi:hypothetical protein
MGLDSFAFISILLNLTFMSGKAIQTTTRTVEGKYLQGIAKRYGDLVVVPTCFPPQWKLAVRESFLGPKVLTYEGPIHPSSTSCTFTFHLLMTAREHEEKP